MTARSLLLVWFALVACATEPTPCTEAPAPTRAPAHDQASGAVTVERVRHAVEVDGHSLAVWEKSPPEPRGVILLVHGRTWSSVPDFDLQVEGEDLSLMDALVRAGWSAYAIDLRGYGGTARDDTGWLTPNRAAADVAAALEWVALRHPGLPKPVLFGWSRGSMVAQLCAQQHPTALSDLVLFGYPTDPDRSYEQRTAPGAPPREATTAKAAASDFILPGTISQAAVSAYVAASLAADPVRADWKDEHQFGQLDPAKVSSPTLIIHGEHDPFAPSASQARMSERLGHPDHQWIVVPSADHAAHLESAGPRFMHALLSFLDRPAL